MGSANANSQLPARGERHVYVALSQHEPDHESSDEHTFDQIELLPGDDYGQNCQTLPTGHHELKEPEDSLESSGSSPLVPGASKIHDTTTTTTIVTSANAKNSDANSEHWINTPEPNIPNKSRFSDFHLKLSSAVLYGTCSFLITVINKVVLTEYAFPSSNILAIGQMIAIIIILKSASSARLVTIRRVPVRNRKVWILATIYLCNLISGLGGTKHLSLPMFTALRRFSIAMTALGEFYLLGVRLSSAIVMTIVAMLAGSFIAAASDLTFDLLGYTLVMVNNFFSAANVVYIKKTTETREINKHEMLYYCALLAIGPMLLINLATVDTKPVINFEHWTQIGFIVSFLASCVMSYLLLLSTIMCTHYNSALTTTIVGTIKNILTTYLGMYIGGDYKFSVFNFVGLNISLIGSLVYSYLTFTRKQSPAPRDQVNKC